MDKSEYMKQLNQALAEMDEETRKEIVEDYEEHFQIGMAKGKSEETIIAELGDINELVKELKHMDLKTSATVNADGNQKTANEVQPNVHNQDSGSGEIFNNSQERPVKKLIIRSKFADVELSKSSDGKLSLAHCNYGNPKQQTCYKFRTWQDGDTVYGEVSRDSVRLLGLINTPHMVISASIPDNFQEVEIRSLSGDTKAHEVTCGAMNIYSASGDIDTQNCSASQINLDTKSGEISAAYMKSACFTSNSASGDIRISDSESERLSANTLSGDMEVKRFHGNELEAHSTSGDTIVSDTTCGRVQAGSISGDVKVSNTQGNSFKGSSKSGDLSAEFCMNEAELGSISGDVNVVSAKDLTMRANSVSGDISIRLSQSLGFTASTKTVSGQSVLDFHNGQQQKGKSGEFRLGDGTSRIWAATTSGDIEIRG